MECDELPTDVIQHILDYGSVLELTIASRVNRRWHTLSTEDVVWKSLSDILHGEKKRQDHLREEKFQSQTVTGWLARTDLSTEQIEMILTVYQSFLSQDEKEDEDTYDVVETLVRRGKTWTCKDEFLDHMEELIEGINHVNKNRSEIVIHVSSAFFTGISTDQAGEKVLEDRVVEIVNEYELIAGPVMEVKENASSLSRFDASSTAPALSVHMSNMEVKSPSDDIKLRRKSKSRTSTLGQEIVHRKRPRRQRDDTDFVGEVCIRLRFKTHLLAKRALRLGLERFPFSAPWTHARDWAPPRP